MSGAPSHAIPDVALHVAESCTRQVVIVIWQKGRIAAAHGRFNRIHQMAPMCTPSNTCFLGSTQVHILNDIWLVQPFLHSPWQCPYTVQWVATSPLKIAPSYGWIWSPSNTCFLGPTQVHNRISTGSAIFAQITADRPTDRPHYSLLVSWSLTSLFSTNMAISETKGQGWKVIRTQWRKASDILTSTLAALLFNSHPQKGKGSRGSFKLLC